MIKTSNFASCLHVSKIKSKDAFSALANNDLEDIINEQKPPIQQDIYVSLRTIHTKLSSDSHVKIG